MKKIEFGHANDSRPNGSWEGLGIKEGLLLTSADYYGIIKYNGDSFVVAKVVEDEYNRYPELMEKFIVRNALADIFADGSGTLYLDQEPSQIAMHLENYLNSGQIKDRITSINDVVTYCDNVHYGDKIFKLFEMDESIHTTSILHEAFEEKNEALKSNHNSFSNTIIESKQPSITR